MYIYSCIFLCSILLQGTTGLSTNDRQHGKATDDLVPTPYIPMPDGLLHFYALPVGQGDAHIIQCPNGDLTIVDLGSSESASAGFWIAPQIIDFFRFQYDKIKNILLTHNHFDHYSFIPAVLSSSMGLTGLENIYVSCTEAEMVVSIQNWLADIQGSSKVRMFNDGHPCGPNGQPCGTLDICPGDASITAKVFASNLASCNGTYKNTDSIVFKITHNEVTILFNGDFEDYTSDFEEDGAQKALIDYYGSEMEVTVFKISHHGAQNLANKPVSCQAHRPRALFVSANSWYASYRHPRCDVMNRFIDDVGTLCKPEVADIESPFYCGPHPQSDLSIDEKLQRVYTCGINTESGGGLRAVTNNEYAIYTTTPDQTNLNLIKFSSDGVRWGFTNNIFPKIF